MIFAAREQEANLQAQGLLYGDIALDAYLQSVMDRLYPERLGEYRVRALRDTEFNAFAVATGHLYVFIGALLRLRNEAELAAVLGHEGGHLLGDHIYRRMGSGTGDFSLQLPETWLYHSSRHSLDASHDGVGLNRITVAITPFKKTFKNAKKEAAPNSAPEDLRDRLPCAIWWSYPTNLPNSPAGRHFASTSGTGHRKLRVGPPWSPWRSVPQWTAA